MVIEGALALGEPLVKEVLHRHISLVGHAQHLFENLRSHWMGKGSEGFHCLLPMMLDN